MSCTKCHVPNSVRYELVCKCPPVVYLFSFLLTGTAFVVIVQVHSHLVQQYRAYVIDSLGLGTMCDLYHCTMCTRHHDLVSSAFYAIPIFHIIYLSPLIFKLI